MNSYALTIIVISVIGGILASLISSSNKGLKNHINFVVGLVSAIILIAPITSFAQNADKISENIDNVFTSIFDHESVKNSNNIILDSSVDMVSEGIINLVNKEFSIKRDNIEIEIITNKLNTDQIIMNEIIITLKNEATWYDEDIIKSYVSDLVGCNVTIKKN